MRRSLDAILFVGFLAWGLLTAVGCGDTPSPRSESSGSSHGAPSTAESGVRVASMADAASETEASSDRPKTISSEDPGALDFEFRKEALRAVAAAYTDWGGPLDSKLRFAPALCRAPPQAPTLLSQAKAGPHRSKVYTVHAIDHATYPMAATGQPALPQGGGSAGRAPASTPELEAFSQIVVKEAFTPALAPDADQTYPRTPAIRDGKAYVAGDFVGLFVLLRFKEPTSGTDAGWIYGTTDEKGNVTGVGLLESCMECHRDAPHQDRLFGLQ